MNASRALGMMAWLVALALLSSVARAADRRYAFGVFGDTPYLPGEEALVGRMIDEMNGERLAFVVHVGDIKASWTRCTNALFDERRALFARSQSPIVVLPGDNDWVDCVTAAAGQFDALERLERFRVLFHDGDASLGARPMRVERQSSDPRFAEYRENLRWRFGDVLYVGVNVPGSNNNLGYSADGDAEHRRRSDAVNAWLDECFGLARRDYVRGVAVFMQGNAVLDGKRRRPGRPDGFAEFRGVLATQALRFAKPVLLVHGDTHLFRVDRPLSDPASGERVSNLTRLEVYGSPQVGWVRVKVDPDTAALFDIEGLPYVEARQ